MGDRHVYKQVPTLRVLLLQLLFNVIVLQRRLALLRTTSNASAVAIPRVLLRRLLRLSSPTAVRRLGDFYFATDVEVDKEVKYW